MSNHLSKIIVPANKVMVIRFYPHVTLRKGEGNPHCARLCKGSIGEKNKRKDCVIMIMNICDRSERKNIYIGFIYLTANASKKI